MSEVNGAFALDALDTRAQADQGIELEIILPDGTGSGFFLQLLGEDSKAYREVMDAQRRKLWAQAARPVPFKPESAIERTEETTMAALVACTKGWYATKGTVTLKGQPLEFSPDNVYRLYTEGAPIIREQAEAAIKNRALFMKRSAAS